MSRCRVAHSKLVHPMQGVPVSVPFALAGTGYGLIGILVIILLVVLIWRLISRR
jgi:hypothetical protein